MRRIGIIGAGRFGLSLAESLADAGLEIIVIDRDRNVIDSISGNVTMAVEGDATSQRALEEAGFNEVDVAVVAIGSDIEVSTMATASCKELGIKMVVAKASSDLHGKILKRIGADSVVFPDRDSAHRLGRMLVSKGAVDLFEISDGCSIAEIDVPENWRGKTLKEAEVRRKTGVTILCIRRLDETPLAPRKVIVPDADETLQAEDKIIVFGTSRQLDDLAQHS